MGQHADRNRPTKHIQGRGKEDAVGGDGNAGGDDVLPQGHCPAGLIDRQRDAKERQSEQQSCRDRQNDEARIDQAGRAKVHTAPDEIQCAIEYMRPGHQDHARTYRDKTQ